MIGHKTERYRDFGWASARLDDLVNWIPARLTALLIAAAAFFVTGADAEKAWTTALRDAGKHASPNAGLARSGDRRRARLFPRRAAQLRRAKSVDLPAFGTVAAAISAPPTSASALELYAMMLNLAARRQRSPSRIAALAHARPRAGRCLRAPPCGGGSPFSVIGSPATTK